MATREFLRHLKDARSGSVQAQLILGQVFLHGGNGLAPNHASALLWLSKAARQGSNEALKLIGEYISPKIARQYPDFDFVIACYREVGQTGSAIAQWHYVQLILNSTTPPQPSHQTDLALTWLQDLANKNLPAACWQLAKLRNQGNLLPADPAQSLYYAQRAADAGEPAAIRWLAKQAVSSNDKKNLLMRVTPLVPELLARNELSEDDAKLLCEYACHLLDAPEMLNPSAKKLALQALHHAAHSGLARAQFHYGLWLARITPHGQRATYPQPGRNGSLKRAAQWLELAAEQGMADAWYVLALLYRRTQFSGYDIHQSDLCLTQAAQLEHGIAQLQLGKRLWRLRKNQINADIEACFWFWRGAKQGISEANILLRKIAQSCPDPAVNQWATLAHKMSEQRPTSDLALLVQRIQIGNQFNLDKAELLLIDITATQNDHCLVVDIQHWLPRTPRRLILIETAAQRLAWLQSIKIFSENALAVEAEGNYRQRRYKLEKLLAAFNLTDGQ
ncbi:MAG: sel1 repeat family protein [Ottowia sp.]|nr:sel1 repeat family protein [Ottowia sp.]